MKRVCVLAIAMLASISIASAGWTNYYIIENVGNAPTRKLKIDWENKYFFLDSDSEDETKCPIKNLKTNGNTKTFDVYYTTLVGGGKYCSVKFTTDEENKFTITLTQSGGYKETFVISDKKPLKDAIRDARTNPKELLKGGVDKISNVFKKKEKK